MFAVVTQIRRELVAFAADANWTALDSRGSVRMLGELATIKRLVDRLIAQAAQRADETNAHAATSDRSGIALAARLAGVETGQMKTAVETVRKLEALPATAAAVRAGRLSAREAELVAGAAAVDPSAEALLLAKTGEGLARLKDECQRVRARVEDASTRRSRMHASRTLRMWTEADGMLHGRFALPTEIGALVKANIDREVQRIFRARRKSEHHEPPDRYAADALTEYVIGRVAASPVAGQPATQRDPSESSLGSQRENQDQNERDVCAGKELSRFVGESGNAATKRAGTNATVHVLIDHAALLRGAVGDNETCEIAGVGPVDLTWVQSLLGNAFVTAIVKRGKDILTVAHLGRSIPVEIQTALVVRGRECCAAGCSCRTYLERDHTRDFAEGGPTSFENLDWLCSYHHRLKSAKRYQLGPKDPVTGKRPLIPPTASAAA